MENYDMIEGYAKTKRRIVIIGSMSVYENMVNIAAELNTVGIKTIVPEAESEVVRQMSLSEFDEFKRRVSWAYIKKIRDPRTFCVLAMNLDRHGIMNYIGPNTFAEIAVAFAQSKRIYLYQGMPDAYFDELSAWGCFSLNGCLDAIINDYRKLCLKVDKQLQLFP